MRAILLASIGAFLCLLAQLEAVRSGPPRWKEQQIDLEGLDWFLTRRLRDVEDPAANFDLLAQKIYKLTGGVRAAGEILMDLWRFKANDLCDKRVLKLIRRARLAGLSVVPKGGYSFGLGRSNRLVLDNMRAALEACTGYVERTFNASLQSLQASPKWTTTKRLIERISPEAEAENRLHDWYKTPKPYELADRLTELSFDEPIDSRVFRSEKAFQSAFEMHFLGPCRTIVKSFNGLVHDAKVIRRMNRAIFGQPQFALFRQLAFANECCYLILTSDTD